MFKELGQIKEMAEKVKIVADLLDKLKTADADHDGIKDLQEFKDGGIKALSVFSRIQKDLKELQGIMDELMKLAGAEFETVKKALGIE